MAVIQFAQAAASSAPQIARTTTRGDAASASPEQHFDQVLGHEGSRQHVKATAVSDQGSDRSASARASADAKSASSKADDSDSKTDGISADKRGDKTGDKSTDRDDDTSNKPSNDDPKSWLGWLQSQIADPATPASSGASSEAAGAAGAFVQIGIAKAISRPGETPPTQAPAEPAPASLLGGADAASDTTLAAFKLTDLGKPAGDGAALAPALTPSLTAALAAALSTSPNAAPELVAKGIEQFQALLSKAESGAPLPSPPAAAPSVSSLLAAPLSVDTPDLPARLGERLQWLVDSGVQEARLQLHPRELGTINVQVRIEAKGASVWFAAEHPAARAALESAMPQLRERFASDGVALGQTQVSTQTSGWTFGSSQQQASPQSNSQSNQGSSRGTQGFDGVSANDGDAIAAAASAPKSIVHIGLIDRYA